MVDGPVHTWHAPQTPAEEMGFKALTEFDRRILGDRRECRINIPVVSRYDLRVVADALRGLATVMDFESRRQDIGERSSLFRIQEEVRLANLKIRDHFAAIYEQLRIEPPKRGGRPRDDERG